MSVELETHQFALPDLSPANIIAATTARELLGQEAEKRQNVFGFLDRPLAVYRSIGETGIQHEIVFDSPPLTSEEALLLLNKAAPHDRYQSPAAIKADWVLALTSQQNTFPEHLLSIHRRVKDWFAIEARADAYVDLAENAKSPQISRDWHLWLHDLPSLRHPSEPEFDQAASRWVDSSTRYLPRKGTVSNEHAEALILQELAKKPTGLFLKRLHQLGYTDAPKILLLLVGKEVSDADSETAIARKIKKFAKKPFEERILYHQAVVELLSSNEDKVEWSEDTSVSRLKELYLKQSGYLEVIDTNGRLAYVHKQQLRYDARLYRNTMIPTDYRNTVNPNVQTRLVNGGNYLYSYVSLPVYHNFDREVVIHQAEFGISYDRIRMVEVRPRFRWETTEQGRHFDVSFTDEEVGGELPTRRITDGLFGLVAIHYIGGSADILPKFKSLPESKIQQAMGAAQLPLLALMYQKKIVGNNKLLQAVEALAK